MRFVCRPLVAPDDFRNVSVVSPGCNALKGRASLREERSGEATNPGARSRSEDPGAVETAWGGARNQYPRYDRLPTLCKAA